MKFLSVLILSFSVVSFAFAGTKEDLEQVQRNVIELQRQFWDLGKQLETDSTNFQNTAKGLQTTTDQLRDNQAALNAKLESILNQMQAFNEKLDETNRRLKELSSAGMQRPMVVTPGETQSDANTAGTGNTPSGSQVNEPENGSSPGSMNPGATQPVAGVAGVPEQQLYQESLAQYTRAKYEQALRGFQDLLDQYPRSAYADDAQYMIGESYYGMKEYVDAVTEYDKVVKRYPDSDKVPGARLKKSFSLFSLGKKGQAVVELQQIVQLYPSSKEAQIARQRLAELGLD
jgi:tol-pal system protein YbgF